jgi:DNA-directed RNA polymerase subunit RPC12/RpoP
LAKVEYVCRKCGKVVTVEQFKLSRFCPDVNCGTLLFEKPQPKHWLFQFNPSTYKWLDRIKVTQEPEQWLVSQHAKLIQRGDLVAIWGSNHNGGIYALGEIITNPTKNPLNSNQIRYFSDIDYIAKFVEKPSVYVKHFKVFGEKPLLDQGVCSEDVMLGELQVLMNPQGTNFRLSLEQWDRIIEITEKM